MYKPGHGSAVLGGTALFYKSITMYTGSLTLLTPRKYRTFADVGLLYGTKCKCLENVPTGRSRNNYSLLDAALAFGRLAPSAPTLSTDSISTSTQAVSDGKRLTGSLLFPSCIHPSHPE